MSTHLLAHPHCERWLEKVYWIQSDSLHPSLQGLLYAQCEVIIPHVTRNYPNIPSLYRQYGISISQVYLYLFTSEQDSKRVKCMVIAVLQIDFAPFFFMRFIANNYILASLRQFKHLYYRGPCCSIRCMLSRTSHALITSIGESSWGQA